MALNIRTDLASEAADLWRESAGEKSALPGVRAWQDERGGLRRDVIEVLDEEGEKALGKPRGRYVTLYIDDLSRRGDGSFRRCCETLAEELRTALALWDDESVLLAALGNPDITPDALGALTAEHVPATRHLKEAGDPAFDFFRSVSVFRSGVLGTTGLESAALVKAVSELSRCDRILAVDALCARSTDKLCRVVQISDAGIVPGSGVGNARSELSRATLGRGVVAVGVPTVVDAATLCADLTGREPEEAQRGLFVTPRDIDSRVRDAARLIGYAVDLALHPGLTVEDVDALLG